MPYLITEPCIGVKDGACVDVCPVDCIHTTDDSPMYYIDPNGCIDCNACRHVCPVDAIFSWFELDEDLKAEMKKWEEINRDFFAKK